MNTLERNESLDGRRSAVRNALLCHVEYLALVNRKSSQHLGAQSRSSDKFLSKLYLVKWPTRQQQESTLNAEEDGFKRPVNGTFCFPDRADALYLDTLLNLISSLILDRKFLAYYSVYCTCSFSSAFGILTIVAAINAATMDSANPNHQMARMPSNPISPDGN